MRKTILIINKFCPLHPKSGGAEKNLLEIFSRIGKKHKVILLSALFPGAAKEETYKNIHIHRIGSPNSENIIRIHFLIPFVLKKYLKMIKPDVLVEDESVLPFFTPLLYPKQKKIVIIHGLNGRHFFTSQRFPLSLAAYIIEKLFLIFYRKETIVVVSEWMRKKLLHHGFLHIHKILNGVDASFLSINKNYSQYPSVLFLGRLEGRKGVDLLLKTFPIVKNKIPSVRFIIAGRRFIFGEPRWLQKNINFFQKHYTQNQIEFMGHVSQKQKEDLFSTSWLYAMPSRTEGYGISVLEANATGTFVIANNTDGLTESVVNNKTGALTNCYDANVFSRKIIEWLNIKKLQMKEGECKDWARTHAWEESAKDMEQLLFNDEILF